VKILVCNVGSTSLKYQFLDMPAERCLARGGIERIGSPGARLRHHAEGGVEMSGPASAPDQSAAIRLMISLLLEHSAGGMRELRELDGIGFKVVGARNVTGAVFLDEPVLRAMEEYTPLLPSHNPPYIAAIRLFRELLPAVPLVGLFETAFHADLPPRAYLYPVPYEWYERHGVRRYGYHGASLRYVAERVPVLLQRPADGLRLVACHLGGSSSICAIQGGRSVDTSMGMSSQAGIPMATRCGDVDPFVLPYVMEREGLSVDEIRRILVAQAGLAGLSGLSGDVRDLEQAAAQGHPRAALALDVFAYAVKKYIGAYAAVLGGIDVLAFAGGIGENGVEMRQRICDGLGFLGIALDAERNLVRGRETIISKRGAPVAVVVVPTNEEIIVARETFRTIRSRGPRDAAVDRAAEGGTLEGR
jgi:acetate kinase